MSKFDWNQFDEVKPQTAVEPSFNWDEHPEVPVEKPSIGESLRTGAEQGVTLGFGDEGQGALEALGQAIGIKGLGAARHLDEWGLQSPNGLDLEKFKQVYAETRDKERERAHEAEKANPKAFMLGNVAGAVAPAMVSGGFVGGLAKGLGKAAPGLGLTVAEGGTLGAGAGLGTSEADTVGGQIADTALGGLLGAGGAAAGYGIMSQADKAKAYLGNKFKSLAEKSAVNATGATGKQASEFADDAGRELLDRKIVRFGDSQAGIAKRAGQAVDAANQQIDNALTSLEKNGVNVDENQIYNQLRSKIADLKKDSATIDTANALEKELDNLITARDARGWQDPGVLAAEQTKRGFNRKAGNWADPEKSQVGKEMYQTWRHAVEDTARNADPKTAALFEEGKKSYGLLAPIQEAAERRAMTTSQSPVGGFLDVTSSMAGGAAAGKEGAFLMPLARRMISPRISSSVAVGADEISKYLMQSQRFSALANKNPAAFQALVLDMSKSMSTRSSLPKAAQGTQGVDSSTAANDRISEEQAKRKFQFGY